MPRDTDKNFHQPPSFHVFRERPRSCAMCLDAYRPLPRIQSDKAQAVQPMVALMHIDITAKVVLIADFLRIVWLDASH